jgi:hypothetical protein
MEFYSADIEMLTSRGTFCMPTDKGPRGNAALCYEFIFSYLVFTSSFPKSRDKKTKLPPALKRHTHRGLLDVKFNSVKRLVLTQK